MSDFYKHEFRDVNPTFKTFKIPPLKPFQAAAQILSARLGRAIKKNGFGRANGQIWEVFTEAIIFKGPLCVSCKASLVCLHFILIRALLLQKWTPKSFFHASQVVVKNANTEKDTDHKNCQSV